LSTSQVVSFFLQDVSIESKVKIHQADFFTFIFSVEINSNLGSNNKSTIILKKNDYKMSLKS